MGLFDKVKGVAGNLKGEGSLMEKFGEDMSKTIATSLGEIADKAKEHLKEDVAYLTYVATPLFKLLPVPVQFIGRERLKWDPILIDVRNELLLSGKSTKLDASAGKQVLEIVKKHHS